jgi:hypothetical protein
MKAKKRKAIKKTHDHEYHVVWNGARRSWDIHRDDGRTGAFAYDKSTAVGVAIREAQIDHGQGLDVIVCVEQKDGTFKQEWASP